MKIKHLIVYYPSMERGGIENNLHTLINYFTKKNIKVTLISSKFIKKDVDLKLKKINFLRIRSKFNFLFVPHRLITALAGVRKLIEAFSYSKRNETVVLSMQSSMVSIIVSRICSFKVVARNSEDALSSTLYADNYVLAYTVFILRFFIYNLANGILTNSYGSKNSLNYFVIKKKKLKTIYNPYVRKIKNFNLNRSSRKNIILSVGRLTKQKDMGTLIKGFSIFSKINPSYKLIILGDGPDRKKLQQLTNHLNLKKKILFKGWVKNTNKYFKNAKIFVLTSLYEGLGNVLIDAVNYEVPCIYTDCKSGPREILLGKKGGYIIKLRDKYDLAKKINLVLNNYNDSKEKIKYAKKKINRFYFKRVCRQYLDYLNKILY